METKIARRAKVHMLSTEEKPATMSMIRLNTYKFTKQHGNPLEYGRVRKAEERGYKYQHLYITTDEEIKEGDNVFDVIMFRIAKVVKVLEDSIRLEGEGDKIQLTFNFRKIIATTDPKLLFKPAEDQKENKTDSYLFKQALPQPSQSFIEEYCKAGGIDEVLVEYQGDWWSDETRTDIPVHGKTGPRIKTDSDNCIIIHPVEEKMYSLDEMKKLAKKVNETDFAFPIENWAIEKWIKENL